MPQTKRRRARNRPSSATALPALGRLPGGEGEQKHRAGPEGVEHRALGVAAGRVQVEEDAVGEGDHAERARRPTIQARPGTRAVITKTKITIASRTRSATG